MESVPSSLIRGSSVKVLLGEGGFAGALHNIAVAVGAHPVVGDVPVEGLGVEVLPHALDVVLVDFIA